MKEIWEYKTISTRDDNGVHMRHNRHTLQDWLTELGRQGWELCGFNWSCAIFKRKVILLPSENYIT